MPVAVASRPARPLVCHPARRQIELLQTLENLARKNDAIGVKQREIATAVRSTELTQ